LNLYKLLERIRPGWQERSKRRNSPWNVALTVTGFMLAGAIWYLSFQFMWSVHVQHFPKHALHLSEFWQRGLEFSAFVPSFLLLIPLLFSSLSLAFLLSNLIFWCIPHARHTLEP
jgi:hypothetical protein